MSIWNGGVALGFTKAGEPIAGHAPICCCVGTPGSGKSTNVLANTILDDDSGERSLIVANDGKAGARWRSVPSGADSNRGRLASSTVTNC